MARTKTTYIRRKTSATKAATYVKIPLDTRKDNYCIVRNTGSSGKCVFKDFMSNPLASHHIAKLLQCVKDKVDLNQYERAFLKAHEDGVVHKYPARCFIGRLRYSGIVVESSEFVRVLADRV